LIVFQYGGIIHAVFLYQLRSLSLEHCKENCNDSLLALSYQARIICCMSRLYPIYIDLKGRKVVVVGGGGIGQEKIESLVASGANVTLISPKITTVLQEMVDAGEIQFKKRCYQDNDEDGAWLVIVACAVQDVNDKIYEICETKRIFCNVVDVVPLCMFHVPSVVRQGKLQIATSTEGASPALASRIRKDLQKQFDPAYATLLDLMVPFRAFVKEKYPDDLQKRSKIFTDFVDSNILELIRNNDQAAIDQRIEDLKKR